MSRTAALQLKAGKLIEGDTKKDKQKLPSRRQLIKHEQRFENLPTYEIVFRLYKRHALSVWQLAAVLTWAAIIWAKLS